MMWELVMINVGVPVCRFLCADTGEEIGVMYQYAVTRKVVTVWYTPTQRPERHIKAMIMN